MRMVQSAGSNGIDTASHSPPPNGRRYWLSESLLSRKLRAAIWLSAIMIPAMMWWNARAFVVAPTSDPSSITTLQKGSYGSHRTLHISVIGDSWACGRGLADAVEKQLSNDGVTAKVTSFGHGGAKSRDVLLNLLKSDDALHSSKPVLVGDTDLCVVVCGVNDTAGYIGADFYSFHVAEIAKLLQSHGVFPIILEVPEFGIQESSSISFLGACRRIAMRWILHAGERDVITAYRDALRSTLQADLPSSAYKLVSFGSVCEDYTQARHLYTKDMCHLSTDGLSRLAAVLSDEINACHPEVPAVEAQE